MFILAGFTADPNEGKKEKKVVASVKFLEPKIKYGKETQTGVPGGEGAAAPKPGRG